MGYRLGVDLGTTFTSAAVWSDDAGWPSMVGLGNRAMQVPSVLFLKPDGEFLVGEAAERRGAVEPGRLVREFKRRLGDRVPILVAGTPYSAQALQARLLAWVVAQVTERQGGPPEHITVTCPANWGPFKRDLFDQALRLAGIADAQIITEPEATAVLYAARSTLAPGETIAVYDLGGGTFDAAVLRKTTSGFEILGTPDGIEQLGGIDFDEAVFAHALASLTTQLVALTDVSDPEHDAALSRLRRDCVDAKEALSADTEADIPVTLPGLSTTIRLVRDEFEQMIGPVIGDTVTTLQRTIASAGIEPSDLTAIVLSGGSSRIPLVTHRLSHAFGRPLALDTHPKHDVALGAAIVGTRLAAQPETATPPDDAIVEPPETPIGEAPPTAQVPHAPQPPAPTAPAPPPPAPTASAPPQPPAPAPTAETALAPPSPPITPPVTAFSTPPSEPQRRKGPLVAVGVVVLAVVAGGIFVATRGGGDDTGSANGHSPTTTNASSGSPTTATSTGGGAGSTGLADSVILIPVRGSDGVFSVDAYDMTTGEVTEVETRHSETVPRLPTMNPSRTGFSFNEAGDDVPGHPFLATFDDLSSLTTTVRPLLKGTNPCKLAGRPGFSPDGSEFALACDPSNDTSDDALRLQQLMIFEADGTYIQTFEQTTGIISAPTWTSDDRIVFEMLNGSGLSTNLYSVSADGDSSESPKPLTTLSNVQTRYPDWDDQRGIIYQQMRPGGTSGDIYVLGPDDTQPQLWMEGDLANPAWSPSGDQVSFVKEVAGEGRSVWIAPSDDPGAATQIADNDGNPIVFDGTPGSPTWGVK